jgi:integrase
MKLKKRGNGFYYIYYSRSNKKSLKTRDGNEANKLLTMEKELVRKGKVIELGKISHIKLSEFKKEYVEGNNDLSARELAVSAGTIDIDKLAFSKFIDICGDMPMRLVKRKHIDDFRLRCLQIKNRETYINILLRSLRAAFNTALSVKYISENPFIKKKGHPPILFRLNEALPRFLSMDEIKALFEQITDPDFLFAIQMYLYTGLRRSELLRLNAQDIDLENQMIKVRRTKSKKDRTVPIPDELKEIIMARPKMDIGPLFPRWTSPDTMSRLFHEYTRAAGIKARLHDLRHSYGTYLRIAGVQLDEIQELMGHADIKTTQIYAKVVNATLKEAANKLKFNFGAGA